MAGWYCGSAFSVFSAEVQELEKVEDQSTVLGGIRKFEVAHVDEAVSKSIVQPTTVITFGTFDLFHIGHLRILQRAKTQGDRLVVGISSDAFSFSKKGKYPIYSQAEREAIISSIKGVDEVFFEESFDAKKEYIRSCDASVLVMGDDWLGKFDGLVPGCRSVYFPRTQDVSTTELIEMIAKKYGKSELPSPVEKPVLTSVATQSCLPAYLELPEMGQYNLVLYQLLKDVKEVFERVGAPFFLIGGNLLGAVRHGGLIPWDDDIDIAVTEEHTHYMPQIMKTLQTMGYAAVNCSELNWSTGWSGWRVERWFDMPKIKGEEKVVTCDIFLMEKKGGQYVFPTGWPTYSVTGEEIYPLKEHKFGTLNVSTPNKFREILSKNFNPSWPTKMKKYNHHFGLAEVTATLEEMLPADFLPAGPFGPLADRLKD